MKVWIKDLHRLSSLLKGKTPQEQLTAVNDELSRAVNIEYRETLKVLRDILR
jgi:hypothetical protein